jgi:hypothetical protein
MTHSFDGHQGKERSGNVQLTTVGSNARCKINGFSESRWLSAIEVRCFDSCAKPTPAGFMLSYANFAGGRAPSSSGAYATIIVEADGTIRADKEWGATLEPVRHVAGHYSVKLRGQGARSTATCR